jgi:hypothetical protein
MIELALALSLAFPLLLGVGAIGIRLGRTLQATQLTRDVAHMYAWGADFSLAGTQAVASKLSQDFNLTGTGQAVLLFSTVYVVQQTDCTAAGVNPCPNLNLAVFTQRVALGNTSLRTSQFGTPPANYIGSGGNILPADYCRQTSLVANGFTSVLALGAGQYSTVVEGYFGMPDLNFLGFPGSGGGYYVRFLF